MLKSVRPLCLRHLQHFHSERTLVSSTFQILPLHNSCLDRVQKTFTHEYSSVGPSTTNFTNLQNTCKTLSGQKRFQHSTTVGKPGSKSDRESKGLLARILESAGFRSGKMRHQKPILKQAGYNLYVCLTSFINYDDFIQELGMPDTMNSWFRVNELHMWLCMVRLAQEGADGSFMRTSFVEAMWEDMGNRAKALGDTSAGSRRKSINLLHTQFKAALLAYDEGLVGDDHVLAGAIWRTFFEMNCEDITKLEQTVGYVRRQLAFLDVQDTGALLASGLMPFLELNQEVENKERSRAIFKKVVEMDN